MNFSYLILKAFVDKFFAFIAFVFLSPLLLLVAILVSWHVSPSFLFRQQRIGYRNSPFELFKFRTMSDKRDIYGILLSDCDRLSSFGRWLRSTSIDELPELYNILRGEMSFIGPRPLLIDYLPLYTPEQARRHNVKPGISGWAQVNGRNSLSWEDKFCMDIWYVDHQSFLLDLRILLITFWKVFRREGISAAGEATMLPFVGTNSANK